jgi:transcriptional regulator with XRE-family HTH domain
MNLKEWRQEKCLSQSELSRLSGVSRSTIIDIENGEDNGHYFITFKKMAKVLNINPSDIKLTTTIPGELLPATVPNKSDEIEKLKEILNVKFSIIEDLQKKVAWLLVANNDLSNNLKAAVKMLMQLEMEHGHSMDITVHNRNGATTTTITPDGKVIKQ